MSFDLHIPEDSRYGQVIQMIAAEQHISLEKAAETLLEEAAQLHQNPSATSVKSAFSSADYFQQLRERGAKRAESRRVAGDPMASMRPETPDALIGFLGDAPEVAQTIRSMAYERRAQSYGN